MGTLRICPLSHKGKLTDPHMPKTILFTGLYPMWHYHLVTELNLAEQHLREGDSIIFARCDADLRACECNPTHLLPHCARCIGIRQAGISLLSNKVRTISTTPSLYERLAARIIPTGFRSLEELKAYRPGGVDLGLAVFSSLVDRAKSTAPDLKEHRTLLAKLLRDAFCTHAVSHRILQNIKPDQVYIFNGRYAAARPWLRACQRLGVPFRTHERAAKLGAFFLYENTLPHDPRPYAAKAQRFWSKAQKDEAILQEAAEFYEERPKGKMSGWYSVTAQQTKGLLPEGLSQKNRNIAIFASSEGEIVSLKDLYEGGLKQSQLELYLQLVRQVRAKAADVEFFLRIHPNSDNEKVRWWEDPELNAEEGLQVCTPSSSVSTYALLNAADKVFTVGSSMGLEATYWGKPSIMIGQSYYTGLDAVYDARTISQAAELLLSKDLPPKPRENALKFSAYVRCAGLAMPHSRPVNYYTLSFKGHRIEAKEEVRRWLPNTESETAPKPRQLKDKRKFRALSAALKGQFGEAQPLRE